MLLRVYARRQKRRGVVRAGAGLTILEAALALDVAARPVLVVVVLAWVSELCGVLEQHAARAVPDGIDKVDGKVRVLVEALAVRLDVALAAGIHDLAGSDAGHELAEGRSGRTAAVDVVNLVGVGHELGLVEALAVLVHGDVLQLGHVEAVAQQIQLVAAHGVLVLLSRIGHVGHIVEAALVQPLDEQLEAGGVVVGQVEGVLALCRLAVALELVLEQLRVVAQQVAVEGPVAPGAAHVDVDHGAREQPVALQLSFCAHMETVRVEAMRQRRPQRETARRRLRFLRESRFARRCGRRIAQVFLALYRGRLGGVCGRGRV